MNSNLIESVIILILGSFVMFSVVQFSRYFYRNPDTAIRRIVLNKRTVWLLTMLFSLNFVFTLGYLITMLPRNMNSHIDLLGILVYIAGTAIFLFFVATIISRKININK